MTADLMQQIAEVRAGLLASQSPFALQNQSRDGQQYQAYSGAPSNLKLLAAASRELGDKTFIVYEDEQLSFAEFFRQADNLAYQLVHEFKVAKGDRIAIAMRNYPEWLIAFYAMVSIGAIAVPLNSWGKAAELQYGLEDSGASILVCDQARLTGLEAHIETHGVKVLLARAAADFKADVAYQRLEDLLAGDNACPDISLDADDAALILYTSGTTGLPKGALSTHGAICQGVFNFNYLGALAAMTSPATIEKMFAAGFEPTALLCLPLFHVSGLHSVFLLNLNTGRKIVMMYKWDVEKALSLIERERVTSIASVPTMTQQLLESPEFQNRDTSSLFAVGGGGAASPPTFSEMIYKHMPNAFAGTGYGMTETNACGASSTGEAYKFNPRATGLVAPIMELEVRSEHGELQASGQQGEVWMRGISLMSGYWQKDSEGPNVLKDGWFDSGDIGFLDEAGYLTLVDRSKDMVIRGGENIYPAEIEACILNHEEVLEAAVFGVPDASLGESLVMVLRLRAQSQLDAERVKHYLAQTLADYKVPPIVHLQFDALPASATGKLLKKALKEAFLDTQAKSG